MQLVKLITDIKKNPPLIYLRVSLAQVVNATDNVIESEVNIAEYFVTVASVEYIRPQINNRFSNLCVGSRKNRQA